MASVTTEVKAFIFIACFLGFWGMLVSSMPSTLSAGPQDFPEYDYPSGVFQGIDLASYLYHENFTFGTIDWSSWEIGGRSLEIHIMATPWYSIEVKHIYGIFQSHHMKWRDKNGTVHGSSYPYWIDIDDIEEDSDANNLTEYTTFCSHFEMKAWISYNTTAWGSLKEAWDNDEAYILFGMEFNQAGTAWSGWSLVANFLTFQAPTVHPTINFFLALPIWICLAFLIVLLVALLLPFVG